MSRRTSVSERPATGELRRVAPLPREEVGVEIVAGWAASVTLVARAHPVAELTAGAVAEPPGRMATPISRSTPSSGSWM